MSTIRNRIAMFENHIIKPKTYAQRKIPGSQSNGSSLREVRVDQSPLRSVEDTVKQLERSPIKMIQYVEPSDGDDDGNDVEWAREFKPYLNIGTSSKDRKEKSKLKSNLAKNLQQGISRQPPIALPSNQNEPPVPSTNELPPISSPEVISSPQALPAHQNRKKDEK